jgi:hypothetical protein
VTSEVRESNGRRKGSDWHRVDAGGRHGLNRELHDDRRRLEHDRLHLDHCPARASGSLSWNPHGVAVSAAAEAVAVDHARLLTSFFTITQKAPPAAQKCTWHLGNTTVRDGRVIRTGLFERGRA